MNQPSVHNKPNPILEAAQNTFNVGRDIIKGVVGGLGQSANETQLAGLFIAFNYQYELGNLDQGDNKFEAFYQYLKDNNEEHLLSGQPDAETFGEGVGRFVGSVAGDIAKAPLDIGMYLSGAQVYLKYAQQRHQGASASQATDNLTTKEIALTVGQGILDLTLLGIGQTVNSSGKPFIEALFKKNPELKGWVLEAATEIVGQSAITSLQMEGASRDEIIKAIAIQAVSTLGLNGFMRWVGSVPAAKRATNPEAPAASKIHPEPNTPTNKSNNQTPNTGGRSRSEPAPITPEAQRVLGGVDSDSNFKPDGNGGLQNGNIKIDSKGKVTTVVGDKTVTGHLAVLDGQPVVKLSDRLYVDANGQATLITANQGNIKWKITLEPAPGVVKQGQGEILYSTDSSGVVSYRVNNGQGWSGEYSSSKYELASTPGVQYLKAKGGAILFNGETALANGRSLPIVEGTAPTILFGQEGIKVKFEGAEGILLQDGSVALRRTDNNYTPPGKPEILAKQQVITVVSGDTRTAYFKDGTVAVRGETTNTQYSKAMPAGSSLTELGGKPGYLSNGGGVLALSGEQGYRIRQGDGSYSEPMAGTVKVLGGEFVLEVKDPASQAMIAYGRAADGTTYARVKGADGNYGPKILVEGQIPTSTDKLTNSKGSTAVKDVTELSAQINKEITVDQIVDKIARLNPDIDADELTRILKEKGVRIQLQQGQGFGSFDLSNLPKGKIDPDAFTFDRLGNLKYTDPDGKAGIVGYLVDSNGERVHADDLRGVDAQLKLGQGQTAQFSIDTYIDYWKEVEGDEDLAKLLKDELSAQFPSFKTPEAMEVIYKLKQLKDKEGKNWPEPIQLVFKDLLSDLAQKFSQKDSTVVTQKVNEGLNAPSFSDEQKLALVDLAQQGYFGPLSAKFTKELKNKNANLKEKIKTAYENKLQSEKVDHSKIEEIKEYVKTELGDNPTPRAEFNLLRNIPPNSKDRAFFTAAEERIQGLLSQRGKFDHMKFASESINDALYSKTALQKRQIALWTEENKLVVTPPAMTLKDPLVLQSVSFDFKDPKQNELYRQRIDNATKRYSQGGAALLQDGDLLILDPAEVRTSQDSVKRQNLVKIYEDMVQSGFKVTEVSDGNGDSVLDVVVYSDGSMTSFDNRRLLAAQEAGVPIVVRIHRAESEYRPNMTWEEAIRDRVRYEGEEHNMEFDYLTGGRGSYNGRPYVRTQ